MAKTTQPKLLTEKFEDFTARFDWRWQRALALFGDGERPVPGFDDPLTVRAHRFLNEFQKTENVSQRQLLSMKYPHEVRAYDLYLNPDSRRFKLEALCLCPDLRQSDVASYLGIDKGAVDLFEKFFFDVRGKDPNHLFNAIFPPNTLKEALGTNLSDKIWKLVALRGGFNMLNCFIDPYSIDAQSMHDFLELGKHQACVDYAVARLVQPLENRDDLRDLSETILRMQELDIKEREASGNNLPEAQAEILQKCLEATHVQVVDPDYKLDSPHELTVEQLLENTEPAPVPVVA